MKVEEIERLWGSIRWKRMEVLNPLLLPTGWRKPPSWNNLHQWLKTTIVAIFLHSSLSIPTREFGFHSAAPVLLHKNWACFSFLRLFILKVSILFGFRLCVWHRLITKTGQNQRNRWEKFTSYLLIWFLCAKLAYFTNLKYNVANERMDPPHCRTCGD